MRHKVRVSKVKAGQTIIGTDGKPTVVLEAGEVFRGLVWIECANGDKGARAATETVVKV